MTSRWPLRIAALVLATLLILLFRMLLSETVRPNTAAPIPSTTTPRFAQKSDPDERRGDAAAIAVEARTGSENPVDETPMNPRELPATAWTRVSWVQGRHAMTDFLEVFLANLAAALNGDADAMLQLAFAIENCHVAASFRNRDEFEATASSGPLTTPADVAAIAALIPDCRRIADEVPQGLRIQQWSAGWLQRAAAEGEALARYLMVNQWEHSDDSYSEAVDALGEAVATGNPWSLREAAEFISNHPPPARDDPYQVEASAWLLLACRADPACDASILEQQIRWAQLPAYAEEIMQRASQLRRRLDAGEAFDFDTGWRAP